jgi:serine/threonine-protein kinase SRPK3
MPVAFLLSSPTLPHCLPCTIRPQLPPLPPPLLLLRMSLPLNHEEQGDDELNSPRFLVPNVGDREEDIEKYASGGLHPVHIGDTYDNGRYRIVHKLGAGGFSTVWLARDEIDKKWVALKIIVAEQFTSVYYKCVTENRRFTIKGPNGRHLCLVLPVFGPSASQLSSGFTARLKPRLSRRASYQVTKAVAGLHAQGRCHGGKLDNLPIELDLFR